MPPRTSGNTCARPISRTASSKTTTRSSPPAARLGAGSKPKPAAFDRSLREAGQASVRLNEGWYKVFGLEVGTRKGADDCFCQKGPHSGGERSPAGKQKAVSEI